VDIGSEFDEDGTKGPKKEENNPVCLVEEDRKSPPLLNWDLEKDRGIN
jgi:hypothetical protein